MGDYNLRSVLMVDQDILEVQVLDTFHLPGVERSVDWEAKWIIGQLLSNDRKAKRHLGNIAGLTMNLGRTVVGNVDHQNERHAADASCEKQILIRTVQTDM